ncbi:MAG: hypothetical protein WB789_07680, partial [Thermoplasmata archaeon]
MVTSAARYEEWLSLDRVRSLSKTLSDPPALRAAREDAHERFLKLPIEPNPLYRGYGYFTGVNLTGIDPELRGAPVPLPPPLPGTLRVVHDVAGTHVEVPEQLRGRGIRLTTLDQLLT